MAGGIEDECVGRCPGEGGRTLDLDDMSQLHEALEECKSVCGQAHN